jgi:hypothetical protein
MLTDNIDVLASPLPGASREGCALDMGKSWASGEDPRKQFKASLFVEREHVGMGLPLIIRSMSAHLPGNRIRGMTSGFIESGVLHPVKIDGPFTILRECSYDDWLQSQPHALLTARRPSGEPISFGPPEPGAYFYEIDPSPVLKIAHVEPAISDGAAVSGEAKQ